MGKRKPKQSIQGRWDIVSMAEWDEEYLHEDVQAFIEFTTKGGGEFQFGYVQGQMDCRATEKDGKPAVESSWEGHDEDEQVFGRGWAVLDGDELTGMIFFYLGDESGFVAKRVEEKPKRKRK